MNPFSFLARLDLRWQLFLIVVVGATPVIALMIYDASRDRRHEAWEIERDAREAAIHAAWRHEQLVHGGRELLVVLAQQREVIEGDVAACSSLLSGVLQQSSRYTMMGVADLGGEVFCSALPLSGLATNVGDRAYFQRAYSTGEFAVGAYQIGRASGKPTLPFAYPVIGPSGAVQSVLFAGLDPGWLAEFATGSELPFDADISVMDRDGAVLAHYPEAHGNGDRHDGIQSVFRANMGQSGEGTASARDHTGRDRYYAFVPLRWAAEDPLAFIGISFPEEEAFADIDRALRRNIAGLLVVAVLAMMAAWWVSARLITRPTAKLVRAANRLAAGDLRERSGPPYAVGEMGRLAAAFDDMAGALQARQESVERLSYHNQTILDTAGEGIFGVDLEGRVTFINIAGARTLGWEVQALIGKPAHETWHHSRPDGTLSSPESCVILRSVREGTVLKGEDEVYWRQDGTSFPVEYISSPITAGNGQVTGAVVTFRDITERKRAEAELRQRYHELSALNQVSEVVAASLNPRVVAATAVEAVLWVLELDAGIIRYMDPATQELVALTDHGLPEGMVRELRGSPRRPVSVGLAGAVARTGGPVIVSDLPGDPRLVSDAMRTSGFLAYIGVPLKVQNEVVGVFSGFSRSRRAFTTAEVGLATSIGNVVGMAIANARLFDRTEASLAEKEALLKEVHHRVKNNLQVISSLLDLQAGSVGDERVLHLFREMQNRVRSMALIHEQLYRAPDLARIQFDDFVHTLTNSLYRSWGVSSDVIDLRANVGSVLVPVDKAVPFGLIINELVSNAFKHAFPGGRRGRVRIEFSLENGKFSLVIGDNGVGMPASLDIERARTLGLQLVNALTRQCRGAMEVHSNGGTEFRFAFPV